MSQFHVEIRLSNDECPRDISRFRLLGDDAARVVMYYIVYGTSVGVCFLYWRGLRVVGSISTGNATASTRGTTIVEFLVFYFVSIQPYFNNPHSREFLCKNKSIYEEGRNLLGNHPRV